MSEIVKAMVEMENGVSQMEKGISKAGENISQTETPITKLEKMFVEPKTIYPANERRKKNIGGHRPPLPPEDFPFNHPDGHLLHGRLECGSEAEKFYSYRADTVVADTVVEIDGLDIGG